MKTSLLSPYLPKVGLNVTKPTFLIKSSAKNVLKHLPTLFFNVYYQYLSYD